MSGDARSVSGDSHLMIGDAQPHHVNLPLQSTNEFNHTESANLHIMAVELSLTHKCERELFQCGLFTV